MQAVQGLFDRLLPTPSRTRAPKTPRPPPPAVHPSLSALKPAQRPGLKNVALSLVITPMVVFIAASVLFSVFWHIPALPAVLIIAILLVALPVSMPHADLKAHLAVGDVLVPVSLCLLASIGGLVNGVVAHENHMAAFYAISLGHSYDNVLASTPGAAYFDAGKLRFAQTSTVKADMALGHRQFPRYCVAPIVDSGEGQLRKVSFWAIGTDCCETRGTFTCGAVEGSARGGVRAVPDGFFARSRGEFVNALKQAAAVSDLVVDDDPILVHWVESPNAEQWKQFFAALLSIGAGSIIFLLVAVLVAVVESMRGRRKETVPQGFETSP